jgi:hypothetical protein
LLSTTLLTSQAQATPLTECTERVRACEEVIASADKAITALEVTIKRQDAYSKALEEQVALINRRRESESAWYKQPSFIAPVAVVLGVVVGAFATKGR